MFLPFLNLVYFDPAVFALRRALFCINRLLKAALLWLNRDVACKCSKMFLNVKFGANTPVYMIRLPRTQQELYAKRIRRVVLFHIFESMKGVIDQKLYALFNRPVHHGTDRLSS